VIDSPQQREWNEELAQPAIDAVVGSLRNPRGVPRFSITLIMPGSPTKKFPFVVRHKNGQFIVERGKFIFEIQGMGFVGPEKGFDNVFIVDIQEIALQRSSDYFIRAVIETVDSFF
jgi:hypothetical protein